MRRRTMMTMAAAAVLAGLAFGGAAQAAFASSRIQVTVQGRGPDVILVPGLSSSPEVWASTVQAVPGYRYHLVQVNGFAGAAPAGNAEGLVSAPVADEIARYVREEKLRAPAVIGHSMGGTIAIMLAARHPDAVRKVMVVDMMPFMGAMYAPPGDDPVKVKAVADAFTDRMINASLVEYQAGQAAVIAGMVNNPAGRKMALAHGAASDRKVSAHAMNELIVTDLRPELSKVTVPTTVLYVHTAQYPITAQQLDAYYRISYANLKGVTLKRVPDSAHFIMFDQPVVFQSELKAFLAE